MKKLFSMRIEVLTGILAGLALVGILSVSGAPTLGVAEGATQFKEGIKSLSAAVVGQDKAKDGLSGACDGDKKGCDKKFARLAPRCDGDKKKDGEASFAALTPNCDGDKKGCDKDKSAALAPNCDGDKKGCDKDKSAALAPNCDGDKKKDGEAGFAVLSSGCDGDKKGCDEKAASGHCAVAGAKAVNALNAPKPKMGSCPKSAPAKAPAITSDKPDSKLAMAE
ncbi:MAG: hypothetical protein RBU21_01240 [FCB group bacterium]|jgi:hypothetical protein|nr:hypothetical protein [FCB group bacterium]